MSGKTESITEVPRGWRVVPKAEAEACCPDPDWIITGGSDAVSIMEGR